MSDVSSGLGYALSIAFIGSLGMLVYRGALTSSLPSDVPTEIAKTAMESVGAAVAVADGFPEMLQVSGMRFWYPLKTRNHRHEESQFSPECVHLHS